MAKKTRAYRGQRKEKQYIGCGCFHCTGHDKQGINSIKEKIIDETTKEIINNFDLYRVIKPFCTFDTESHIFCSRYHDCKYCDMQPKQVQNDL
jgi:hypothetical protein